MPGAYPTSATCDFHIKSPRTSPINITFINLDLPEAINCTEVDHIIVYSVVQDETKEVRTICGQLEPDSFLTFNSNILIRFITKSANALYSGFHLKFESSSDDCGNTIEASTGIIESPGYPKIKDRFLRYCQLLIQVCLIKKVQNIASYSVTIL